MFARRWGRTRCRESGRWPTSTAAAKPGPPIAGKARSPSATWRSASCLRGRNSPNDSAMCCASVSLEVRDSAQPEMADQALSPQFGECPRRARRCCPRRTPTSVTMRTRPVGLESFSDQFVDDGGAVVAGVDVRYAQFDNHAQHGPRLVAVMGRAEDTGRPAAWRRSPSGRAADPLLVSGDRPECHTSWISPRGLARAPCSEHTSAFRRGAYLHAPIAGMGFSLNHRVRNSSRMTTLRGTVWPGP